MVLAVVGQQQMYLNRHSVNTAYSGTIFYVDTNGNNANNGKTPATAWHDLHYAATNSAVSNNCIIEATSGEIFVETNFLVTNLNALPNGSNVVFTTT